MLDALQGRGLLENTIVVYTSDHGMLMGQDGLYGKTNASALPNFYEEVIRIPLVIYASGVDMRQQQTRDEFVDLLDLHATILDYASDGTKTTTDGGPGRSLRTLLRGERSPGWRQLQFAERGNARMVSDGRWKLVRYYENLPLHYTGEVFRVQCASVHTADSPAHRTQEAGWVSRRARSELAGPRGRPTPASRAPPGRAGASARWPRSPRGGAAG